jgi:putative phosphonate catabolism associated alcohol dehydrogenase
MMDGSMTKSGRAVVYDAPNEPFEIREFPVRDVKSNEVLARVTMATICRSDIHSYQGHRPNPCPGILGHEIIGVVEQIGQDIENDMRGDPLAVGDRVTWTEYFHSGESYHRDIQDLPQKSPGLRKYGHDLVGDDPHFLGGFADYCYIMPGTGILKLPDELSDEEATPLNCGVATMISMTEAADISMGDCVIVQGLGLLGLYGCAIAKARGARMVIGLDGVTSRRDMAKSFGADEAIDISTISEDDVVAKIKSLCRPDGANVVMEVCGFASAVPTGVRMLGVGGRYVIGGLVNPNDTFEIDGNELLRKLITLKGVHNYHPRHLIQALDFVMANRDRFPFKDLVDSKFGLEDLNEAFAKAADRTVLRAAIIP